MNWKQVIKSAVTEIMYEFKHAEVEFWPHPSRAMIEIHFNNKDDNQYCKLLGIDLGVRPRVTNRSQVCFGPWVMESNYLWGFKAWDYHWCLGFGPMMEIMWSP